MSSELNATDVELFEQAMRHVTPLKASGRVAHMAAPRRNNLRPSLAQQQRRERAVAHTPHGAPLSDAFFDRDADIHHSFRVNGLSADALRRLRKESHAIRASLDLHGLTIEQARSTLHEFVKACTQRCYKRIRIIHGQGYGSSAGTAVLKQQTRHWLTQMPEILGYVAAPPHDGGDGAVLVLLRSAQKLD